MKRGAFDASFEFYFKCCMAGFALAAVSCGAPESRPLPVAESVPAIALSAQAFDSLKLEMSLPYGPWSGPVQLKLTNWAAGAAADATSRTYQTSLSQSVPRDARLAARDASGVVRWVERRHTDLQKNHGDTRSADGTWTMSERRHIELTLPNDAPPPSATSHLLLFSAVSERERRWIFDGASRSRVDEFVRRQVEVEGTTRKGLLLPAPARVSWRIEVPPAAELSFSVGLLPPEWHQRPLSNGGRFSVDIRPASTPNVEHRIYSEHIRGAAFELERVNLSGFAGQSVELIFDVNPAGSSLRDYLFVAEPVVASRQVEPRRAVILFVDTLRPDRLGLHGNPRDVSPALDAWAARGGVYENARSVAPWTLPSARSLLTGRAPEAWNTSKTLPERVGEHGFATALFGANTYLMRHFGVQRGWDEHSVVFNAPARDQTDRALAWLEAHEGRDALLVVHYMDPHLPYLEPPEYRDRFGAGEAPVPLPQGAEGYSREDVLRAAQGLAPAELDALASHLLARYDANVRYVDDEIGRLLRALSPQDIVVLVSDHGEEFFDHGSFEHGHAFGESILRIPLIFAGRGIVPGRYPDAVSILDVVPTLLDAFSLSAPDFAGVRDAGRSLWTQLQGGATEAASQPRALGFGRPLHGPAGWGVVQGGEKYVARAGSERRSQVHASSAHEAASRSRQLDPAQREPMRAQLASALDREFVWAWRFFVEWIDDWPPSDLTRSFQFGTPIEHAWVGTDPTLRSSVAIERGPAGSGRIDVTWRAGYRGASEVFVVAAGGGLPMLGEEALALNEVVALTGEESASRSLRLTHAWVPLPLEGSQDLVADDPALRAQLRALGYLVGEDAPPPSPE